MVESRLFTLLVLRQFLTLITILIAHFIRMATTGIMAPRIVIADRDIAPLQWCILADTAAALSGIIKTRFERAEGSRCVADAPLKSVFRGRFSCQTATRRVAPELCNACS